MTSSSRFAILFIILTTVFTSIGQILWKFGVGKIILAEPTTAFNFPFLLGFLSYGAGLIFMILALQRGELTVVYPIIATSYVWVSLLSPLFFPDSMNGWKWMGIGFILLSVSLLGFGNSGKKEEIHG